MKINAVCFFVLLIYLSSFSQVKESNTDIPKYSLSFSIENGMQELCDIDLFSIVEKKEAEEYIKNFIFFARGTLKTENFSYKIIGEIPVKPDSCNFYVLKEEGLDPNSPWLAYYIIVIKDNIIERSVLAAIDESEPAASKNITYTEVFDTYFSVTRIVFDFDPDQNPDMDALESENTQRIMYDFIPAECSFWAYPTD
ncbi:MAG: hypothetical protein A2W91_10800 [Bacteroidetes bacterium GWF2_38_335]|nr:MAG: hypothetical protein A2W91_10800 [Bacteroidetes bacterium GWF2_38_335]OFY81809.1 MAG: hypothetical protein A2281_06240 [Bacteroidetes bacterium RIFOXYA12_FULL_38_20]HBS87881.1 hypothetical protein [Bacteroidales bacterium]